jgi:multidrug efflux pump subunit AcrA (membrane-fusion protein)
VLAGQPVEVRVLSTAPLLRDHETIVYKDEKAETFYRVMVCTDTNHLGSPEHPLPIIPGMVATVEVLTGHKTVLDYLIKPARLRRER